ncbi:MAG TPA: hypothetical protein VHX63_05425 [Acidobacteriaceae bacterium]|jgi:hypothetical protein|nr:hypothetical protein [Acidobacteriaceae bacterium]
MLTTAQPTSPGSAYLYEWGASLFDPSYNQPGVSGNDTGNSNNNNARFGVYVRQQPGQATLVDCEIAGGATQMAYYIQTMGADGSYISDYYLDGMLQAGPNSDHWTVAVSANPKFSTGYFRLMFVPLNVPYAELWGCQISPVS